MAVHFVQQQTPWWGELAKGILVPMISGAIERQRQRDENRKNNALLAKTMNDILGQAPTPIPQGASGGYGGNNWENAFHSSQDNPMAQFNAGTADLMPPSMQGVQAAIPQQKAVGSSDFLRALAANMGTERFGMVDPKYIQELATPYIANLEAAKAEARRANAADAFRNAEGAYGRASSMLESAIRGDLPESYVNTAGNFYKATMPQPMMQDLGGSLQGITYDPTTGTFTNAQSWDKSHTPQQAADNQYRNDVFDYTKQKDARDFNEAQRIYNINREDANRPKYGMPVAAGGKLWQFDQYGNRIPFEIDGVQIDAPQGFETWTERDKAELGAYQDELKSIREDIKTWRDAYNNAQTDEERQYADNMLRGTLGQDGKRTGGLYTREAVVRAAMLNKFRNPQKVSYKSAGRLMLEDGETATIVKGGEYKTKRTKSDGSQYNHAGTDYAMPEGTRILVHQDFGENFKVVRANTDPKASTYGCFVEIEGTRNGKRVKYLMAHMKQGSIGVAQGQEIKAGEYLGSVGNTGHSHGNHLHLEIREWDGSKWVLQDPEKYLTNEPISKATSTTQPAENGQPAPQNEAHTNATPVANNAPPAGNGQRVSNPYYANLPSYITGNAPQQILPSAQRKTQVNSATRQLAPANTADIANLTREEILRRIDTARKLGVPEDEIALTYGRYVDIPPINTTPTQTQTVAGFSTPAAYAAEPPSNTVSGDVSAPVVSNDIQLTPPFSSDIPVNTVNSGDATLPVAAPPTTSDDIAAVLREANQGAPQYDLSNADLTASLPGSGVVPRAARRIDPDGGLTQYRADGDNTPVTWRNKSGNPMRTSDGQLFTQGIYEDWKRKADAGHFKDVNINNAEDLNKWLEKIGMRPDRPSEQRGVNNLNGNTSANSNLPPEGEDENITPFNITPSNSPEKFQAPEFTDEINGTTPSATQDLLDGLNGITNSRYRGWTETLKRITPSGGNFRNLPYTMEDRMNSMIDGIGRYIRYGDRYGLRGEQDLLLRPEDNRNSFTLANDTSSRLPNYTPLLNDTISRLGYGQPPANPYQQPNYPLDTRANDPYVGDVSATRPPMAIPSRTGTSPTVPQQATPQRTTAQRQVSQRPSSKPRAGYTNYEQQRTHVDGAAKRHGVDSALIRAIIETESSWKPNARSKVGAMGLMQLMPKTAKWLGVRNAYDPAQNIEGGSKYIAQLIRQFGGNVSKALMAYNCGPGNVKKGRIPAESRRYAQKVLGIYRRLKGQ